MQLVSHYYLLKIFCVFTIRNFLSIQLKISKNNNLMKQIKTYLSDIIWRPILSISPSNKWSNSFSLTISRKRFSISPLTKRLHQPSYKMFCIHFGHVTKIKFFPIYFSGTICSINWTADDSFFPQTMYYFIP